MAVASPIYASTGSRWQAMKWTLLSSLCEPLAAVLFGVLFSSYLTPYLLSALTAGVAGVMVMLCLVELVPTAASSVGARVRGAGGGGRGSGRVPACEEEGARRGGGLWALGPGRLRTPSPPFSPPSFPQAAAVSNLAGQAVMFASLYAMRAVGAH